MSLSDRYNPKDVEPHWYKQWEERGYFKAQDQSTKPPFSIILPPPNVTGQLHLGHALDHSIQDVLVRWKRMSGFNTLWLPGSDHAGIATQSVVERQLRAEGTSRQELGREKFLERVWAWKEEYGGRIYEQMKKLGDSVDWDREVFTLDPGVSKAVRKVFVELYKKGYIYRGKRLVNWSTPLQTAISDLEVEHKEVKGSLWHLRYPLEDGSGEVVVATTRPETMLGDTAVAVHPEDERYKTFVGKNIVLPLTGRKIPILADDQVDPEFGTGAVKITPAHDFNDYEMGERHKLPLIALMEKNGKFNEQAGPYKGLSVLEARKKVVEDLEAQGALLKVEPYQNKVGFCSRSGAVVEPFLSEQWFLKMSEMATPARHVVENGSVSFVPESWTKTYLHWMNIIEDWCISRQLWWGHRIPAWTCESCAHIQVAEEAPETCEKCQGPLKQDEDVLDTWFSSALWPFSTLDWPEETEAQKTFYPTSVLVTGHDIIFFWVARMIMMGLEFKGDIPFRTVYLHGLIRDSQGRKMSKSLGNSVDPIELIETHGADALRFTLLSSLATGRDIKFFLPRLEGYRNFMNKIWNAARFSLGALTDYKPEDSTSLMTKAHLSLADRWIIFETALVEKEMQEHLENYRFQEACHRIYNFVWREFCDWYLELVKPVLYGEPSKERTVAQHVLATTLNRIVRLLHPFTPFITEELYQKLPVKGESVMMDTYPTVSSDKEWLAHGAEEAKAEVDFLKEVIVAIRNIRGENSIQPGLPMKALLHPSDARSQKVLGENKAEIVRLSRISECEIVEVSDFSKCAVTPVQVGDLAVTVVVPLEGLVDFEEEIRRIDKTVEKLERDIAVLDKKLSNPNFVKNAPADIVKADQAQIAALKAQTAQLREHRQRLR